MVSRATVIVFVLIVIIMFQSILQLMFMVSWNTDKTMNIYNEMEQLSVESIKSIASIKNESEWIFMAGWLASGTPIKKYQHLSLINISNDDEDKNMNEINYRIKELKRLTILHNGDLFTAYGWIKTHIRPKKYWHISWKKEILSNKPYLGSYYLKHKYGDWCTLRDKKCIKSFEKKEFQFDDNNIERTSQCKDNNNIKNICIPKTDEYTDDIKNELFYRIKKGYKRVKNYKIGIGVPVKNDVKKLEKMVNLFISLGGNFKDYRIIFMENDSTDKTDIELINNYCKKNEKIICMNGIFHFESKLKSYGGMTIKRLSAMSLLRQTIMNIVKYLLIDFDYLLMADSDEIIGFNNDINHSLWPHIIMSSFYGSSDIFNINNNKPKWSYICSNGVVKGRRMWDTFPFNPLFIDDFFMHLDWDSNPGASIANIDGWEHIAIKYNIDLIPVTSCYAPFAIYNMQYIHKTNCQYDNINDEGKDVHQPPVSEHATINNCLDSFNNNNDLIATNFLNPFMLGFHGSEPKNLHCKQICIDYD